MISFCKWHPISATMAPPIRLRLMVLYKSALGIPPKSGPSQIMTIMYSDGLGLGIGLILGLGLGLGLVM